MEEKTKVEVKINGKEYTIIASEPIEYIHKIASYVDKKMYEIAAANNRLSTAMVAVLSAINLADEVHKSKQSHDNLRSEIVKYASDFKALNSQVSSLEMENISFKREIDLLKKENAEIQKSLLHYKTKGQSSNSASHSTPGNK